MEGKGQLGVSCSCCSFSVSLEKCIFDDVLEKYCCWLPLCRSCCPHQTWTLLALPPPPPTPPHPPPPPPKTPPTCTQLWRLFFSKKLSKTHFYSLQKCIFDDVLEKYCCWLTVCGSFQKNYLKRTFAASKSAFSIMSYESITAGCLFAGRACSTHPQFLRACGPARC